MQKLVPNQILLQENKDVHYSLPKDKSHESLRNSRLKSPKKGGKKRSRAASVGPDFPGQAADFSLRAGEEKNQKAFHVTWWRERESVRIYQASLNPIQIGRATDFGFCRKLFGPHRAPSGPRRVPVGPSSERHRLGQSAEPACLLLSHDQKLQEAWMRVVDCHS